MILLLTNRIFIVATLSSFVIALILRSILVLPFLTILFIELGRVLKPINFVFALSPSIWSINRVTSVFWLLISLFKVDRLTFIVFPTSSFDSNAGVSPTIPSLNNLGAVISNHLFFAVVLAILILELMFHL